MHRADLLLSMFAHPFLFVCLQWSHLGNAFLPSFWALFPDFVHSHRYRVLDPRFELCLTSVPANNCEKATNNSCCIISRIIELYCEFRFDREADSVSCLQSLSCWRIYLRELYHWCLIVSFSRNSQVNKNSVWYFLSGMLWGHPG